MRRVYTSMGKDKAYQLGYRTVAYYVVMYLVPLLLLSVLVSRLIVYTRKAHRFRQNSGAVKTEIGGQSTKEITRVLIAIVLVYLFCQPWNPVR